MEKLYGALGIKISSQSFETLRLDVYAISYLKCHFPDLKNKLEQNKINRSKVSTRVTNEDVFKAFVEDCCHIANNAICEKTILYETYSKYYKKHFYGEPLTRIVFGKKFSIYGNFETVRPHTSREHYPYCFKGIEIDLNKMKRLENESFPTSAISYEKFREELIKILLEN